MTTAFQRSAFQTNAFQIDGGQLGGGGLAGSSISGGTFSRGRWRALREDEERAQENARRAKERKAARALEIALARSADAKAALRAKWVQQDAIAAAASYERLLQGAMSLSPHIAPSLDVNHLRAIQAQHDQDDEEEAIALLLMS